MCSFLAKLKDIKDNHAFLALIQSDFTFLMLLNNFMRDQPEASLEEIRGKVKEFAETPAKAGVAEYLALIEALYVMYIRENVTGPSLYTRYVEEELRPLQKDEPLPEKETDPISNKNTSLQEKMLSYFERDSEQIYLKTQFLIIFFALETLLLDEDFISSFKDSATEAQIHSFDLWKARYYYLHDK